jgi:hypothetical protein
MKYPSLSSTRQSLPNAVLILAPHMWGASPKDRWMWMAEKNGQVLDYDAKWCLIRDYLKAGDEVYVLTCHKDGTVTAKQQIDANIVYSGFDISNNTRDEGIEWQYQPNPNQ